MGKVVLPASGTQHSPVPCEAQAWHRTCPSVTNTVGFHSFPVKSEESRDPKPGGRPSICTHFLSKEIPLAIFRWSAFA